MTQFIHATFRDGVFVPEQPVSIAAESRVMLTVEPAADTADKLEEQRRLRQEAFARFQALCDRLSFNSGGVKLTRDELHERR